MGAGGGEEEKKAYLVQGETSGGVRRRKKVLQSESGDAGEEGGGGVQRMDKVLQRMLRGWRLAWRSGLPQCLCARPAVPRREMKQRMVYGGCCVQICGAGGCVAATGEGDGDDA